MLMKTIKSILIILFCLLAMESSKTYAQVTLEVGVTVRDAPPPLPVYTQPPCPVDGYFWTPGYWAYNSDDGFYWVPGVWVRPPHYGYLWTPGYWGFSGGYYGFHPGYWGLHIGYYGGVNYGYGYVGSGYCGGRWEGNSFRYNTAVVNVNTTVVHNTYVDRTVIVNNTTVNRASYNGPGGVKARPTHQEEIAMRERHIPSTSEQTSHQQMAGKDRNQFASVNKGRPATAAMNKVGGQSFNSHGKRAIAGTQKSANHNAGTEGNKPVNRQASRKVNKSAARSANPNQGGHMGKQQTKTARSAVRPHSPRQNQKSNKPRQGGEAQNKRNEKK
jgi:hypothetical protein